MSELTDENRALIERVVPANLRVFYTGVRVHNTTETLLNAAREEERTKLEREWRTWRRERPHYQRLAEVRQNICGLRPGDAEAIADAETRLIGLERQLAALSQPQE